MFVVRIDHEDEASDFKALTSRPDAEKRFDAATLKVWNGELPSAALFEVAGVEDARKAVEAVKTADKKIVRLLAKEPVPLDLDDLDLDLL